MKKPTFSKLIFVTFLFLLSFYSFGQNLVPFTVRYNTTIKGDMLLIGNNLLSVDKTAEYNTKGTANGDIDCPGLINVDIDADPDTFNSSSADLAIPSTAIAKCYKIKYAGLYWGAVRNGATSITSIKFKLPGGTKYEDLTGTKIYSKTAKKGDPKNNFEAIDEPGAVGLASKLSAKNLASCDNTSGTGAYACYVDVTALISNLADPTGTYTVANASTAIGTNGGTGLSAGWSLYIVYEDPTMTSKNITSFDGFTYISSGNPQDITVTGFNAIPVGPVRAKYAFSALEGDRPYSGDFLSINGKVIDATNSAGKTIRPDDNFFNSTVSYINTVTKTPELFTTRNPNSLNTLGFDAGILEVPNSGNKVIKNGDQSATIHLDSNQDVYYFYFNAFSVDIIEPKIVLTKVVQDNAGNDMGNKNVTLGDQLNYVIGITNTGNDDATSLTVRDVLPINIIFNYPADMSPLPDGVKVKSYNSATREIVFEVENRVVEEGDATLEIRFKVKVVPDCNMLSDACSNIIDNTAYATYKGTLNPLFTISDDPSINANTGCLLTPKATNFLVGIDNCKFTKNEVLCTGTVTLKAANGYSSYSWSSSPTGTPVLGTGQTLTVSKVGTYYVHDTAIAPCLSIDETVTVTSFGGIVNNPVIPFADQVVVCTSDGKKLPNIFLCGANASKLIQTNISDGSTIVWEKLNESAACPAATSTTLCANESATCSWTKVATGPDFLANTSGQFRVTLTYPGGCFNRFYFNVFQNLLNPTATSTDIYCNTPAKITVGGIGAGYEYSLDGITYQSSNVFPNPSFPVVTVGSHTVYIRQIGVANGCIFEVKNIQILDKVLKVVATKVTQPLCFGDKGSIKVAANGVRGQYTYTLYKNGVFDQKSVLTNADTYEFINLDGGTTTPLAPITYTIEVTTDDGCKNSVNVDLIMPDPLTVTASLTKPFTCNDGEITINPKGGTSPYAYNVNGIAQSTSQIIVTNPLPSGGKYDIEVLDYNGCKAVTSITVNNIPKPVYTVTKTDVKCYGDNTGSIQFNVTNANGYALSYSIDGGATFLPTSTFSNLIAGTYNTILRYTLGTSVCDDTMQVITIAQPTTALTASAGVSELAGCDPSGAGKVRITNPQGGKAPYTYSFDGGLNYIASNDAYVMPGTYTLYIKDSNGCIFPMSGIILDPVPAEPTIVVSPAVFNCNGMATSTVTATNPASASYTYTYLIDGVANTNVPPNIFVNVPSGSHTISVGYTLTTVPTFSNLLNEDFGSGSPTTTSGIAAAYCFNDQRISAPYLCGTRSVEDNQYSVANDFWRSDDPSHTNVGAWYHFKDHTTNGVDANGRFLLVNIGSAAGPYGVLYSKPIIDVIPNQPVKVQLYVANLLRSGISGAAPIFRFELVDPSGTVVSSVDTGKIAELPGDPLRNQWIPISLALNPGIHTNLTFQIRSGSLDYAGNDAIIDDIKVFQLPKACITKKDYPIVVASNQAFSASIAGHKEVTCAGAKDGEITIAAQNFNIAKGFDYSMDNGASWTNSLVSPVTVTGLANGTYAIQVRYDNTASTCKFPFTQIITAPIALVAGAAVTTPAKCTLGATITASATGGTVAYQYELRDAGGVTVIRPYQLSTVFANVPPGSYIISTKDANNCTDNVDTPIVISAPVNPIATLDATSDLCFDSVNQASLVVNASLGNPPYTYSLDGAPAQNSNTFNNVSAAAHSVLVTDSYGCTATALAVTIAPQLTALATTTKALDCSATPDAVISVNITGGNAPFTYKVKKGAGTFGSSIAVIGSSFTNSITAANADTYTYEITDAKGCVTTATATVNPLIPVTATTTNVNPSCNGATNGSVQIIPAGGVGSYTFSFNGSPFTTTSLYSNLSAGIPYSYTVKDNNGCTVTNTVTLTEPTALIASASATAFSCSAANTKQSAIVTIAVPTTGTPTYQYSFNGGGYTNTNTLTLNDNGTDQVVSYSVKDSKGCFTAAQFITVNKLNPPTNLSFSNAAITCTAATTAVTLTATNGVGTLQYETIAPSPVIIPKQNSNLFAGLSPGTYTFRVTDANGCYFTKSHVIAAVVPIAISGNINSNVNCKGDATGKATFTVSGNATVGAYSFVLTAGTLGTGTLTQAGNTLTLLNVAAGTYTVQVTDTATGCVKDATVIITEPTSLLSATVAQVNANCNVTTAKVTITPAGGTASYTYAYKQDGVAPIAADYVASNVANLNPATNVNWDVWVKDAKGCTIMLDVTIVKDPLPTVTVTAAGQCLGVGSYTLTANGSGGVGTLTYSINGGASYQPGNTFVVATAGSYTIRVKDANGCTADSTPIVVASRLTVSAVLNKGITCNPAPTDAQMTINAVGGVGPFTYTSSPNTGTFTGNVFNTSAVGSYIFTVTDSKLCSASTTTPIVTTTPINPVITGVTQTAFINCNNDDTAAISIAIDNTKGQAPFVFNVKQYSDLAHTILVKDFGTQTSGLPAGFYVVTVTDAKGCTDTQPITITEPTPMVIDKTVIPIQCNGSGISKGSIIINKITDGVSPLGGTGGTAPYTYYVTGINNYNVSEPNASGTTSVSFNIVDFGLYQIRVVDANGCSIIEKDVLVASPPNSLGITINPTVTCATGGSAIVKITSAFAGAGPFHFNIYNGPGQVWTADGTNGWQGEIPAGSKETLFSSLLPGVTYTFIVYDENTKCYYYETAAIPVPSITSLSVNSIVPKNITCKGSNDGNVSFDITNASGVSLDYTYEVFEAFTNISKYVSGTFSISGSSTINIPNIPITLGVGSYYVYIKEMSGPNSGCGKASANFNINESPIILTFTASKIKNVNCNEDGIIAAQPQGGTAPYTYQYLLATDPVPTASTAGWIANTTFATSVTGNYIVYVKDAYGCIKQDAVTLVADALPTISAPSPICYDGSTAFTIDLSLVSSATILPVTYSVSGSAFQSSPNFTFNAAGTYNLVIKDGNGCMKDIDYIVYPKLILSATLTKELDCTGTPDATITLSTIGGNTSPAANYTYEVSTNGGTSWAAMAANVYLASSAGTYDFRVTDGNNTTLCQATKTLVLDPIPTTVFTTTQTHVSCNGDSDGTITVNVTAGEGPYQFSLTDGVTTTPFQTGNSFSGLVAGTTYVVTVRNARNCTLNSAAITITEPNPLLASSAITTPLTCGAGNVAQPATVTVTATPGTGTAPYQYSFDGGANYSSVNTYQSSIATTFNVFVKDAKGCVFTLVNGVNIPALNPPTEMDIAGTPVYCLPVASQKSTVTISNVINGVGVLSYAILSPATATGNVSGASNGIFTGLDPDTYAFQVKDANGCTYQEAYTVKSVTNITVSGQLISNVTCNPGNNGEVLFTVGNFGTTYSYSINGAPVVTGQNNPTITVSGITTTSTQTIVVTDEVTGCTATVSVNVIQNPALALTANPFINANCNKGAQVSVTATGGVAPYTYSYVPAGSPAGTFTNSSAAVLNPGTSVNWDVYVKDVNNCVITTPLAIAIATDPVPSGISISGLSQCPSATGTYTFTINVATGMAPYQYNIGNGFQSSPTFTVNAPGTYNVTVKDANQCSTTVNGLVNISPALQLQATISTLPSCSNNDGKVDLLATGGSGNYEYNIDGGAYFLTSNFAGVTSGSHTFMVRDLINNSCTFSVTVNLKAAVSVTGVVATPTNVTCSGGTDGSITVTLATPAVGVNDDPIYTYSLSGTVVRPAQNSNVFNGLPVGNYTVTVTSGRNCQDTKNVSIVAPPIITVPAPTVTQYACTAGTNGTNYASISVAGVTGGSNIYTIYEFVKGATVVQRGNNPVYIESDLSGGNYTVNVYDNKGCVGTAPAIITINRFISINNPVVTVNNPITCPTGENITVTVTTVGGVPSPALQYSVQDIVGAVYGGVYNKTNTTGIFTDLPIGNYSIKVLNPTTGCSVETIHYVKNPNTFELQVVNKSDVVCFGSNEGSVEMFLVDRSPLPTDESGPYSYVIKDASGAIVQAGNSTNVVAKPITGLTAGIYSVTATLTNSPFCAVSKNFTISGPAAALDISETHTRITCASNTNGTISATAVGGWPGGYLYQLELGAAVIKGWSTVSDFSGLGAGSYILKVKDTKGCEDTVPVTLSIPTPIAFTATPSTTLLTCFGDTSASISVSAPTGGQGSNYLYTLNTTSVTPNTFSGPQASPVFANLGAGTYTVTVTDGFSCSTTSAPIVIAQPNIVKASLVVSSTQTCTVLTSLTLSATGGTGLYSYSTTPNFAVTLGTFASSVTFTVPTGTHRYYVKDANGCISIVSNDITIDPLVPLTIKLDVTNAVINCRGDNTGVIVATANGGLGNYVYTLLDDATNTPIAGAVQTTPGYFTNLAAGSYKVRVVSRDCNTTTATITITQPNLPLIAPFTATPVTCNGNGDGKVVINASGGTGVIKYAISPNLDQFFESNTFNKLKPNNYDVIVQDVLGCYVRLNFTITEPNPIDVITVANSIIPEICVGDKNGAFKINVTGGVAPYSVDLDKPNAGNTTKGTIGQTQFDFTRITGGDHMVYVTDMNGCTAEWKVSLPKAINLDPKAAVTYECDVNTPGNKVTVTVDPSNTVASDIDYTIDGVTPFQASNVFANVAPGLHYVEARHTNGCIQKFNGITVDKLDPLSLSLDLGGLNEIVATISGGSGIYQLTVNGEPMTTQNKFIYFKSGDYTVTLTDSNGCTVSATKHFEFIDIIIPPIFTPTGDSTNDTWKPTNTENYPDIKFIVYDRYGREVGVFGAGESWDGKYNGTELPMGDYWYVLKLKHSQDDREFIGHFTLYR